MKRKALFIFRVPLIAWMLGFGLLTHSNAQELKIAPPKGPFYVGDEMVIQVVASQLESDAKVELENQDSDSDLRLSFDGSSGIQRRTEIINGRMVMNKVLRVFQFSTIASKPGKYRIGPFKTIHNGKGISSDIVEIEILPVEIYKDMKIDVTVPAQTFYPGQKIPVMIVWKYGGDNQLTSLLISSSLFEEFKFVDIPFARETHALAVGSPNGPVKIPAVRSEVEENGGRYLVLSSKRLMIAEKAGKFDLPGPVVEARMRVQTRESGGLFGIRLSEGKTIPIKATGSPISFEVKPFPPEKPTSFNGAVGKDFSIQTTVNRSNLRVGDSVSLQVNITGDGNTDSLGLPNLRQAFPEDQFDLPSGDAAGIVNDNQKQFNVSIRIKDENIQEIPPLEFSWFDVETEEYVTVTSPSIPVDVSEGKFISSNDVVSNLGTEVNSRDNGRFDLNDQNLVDLSIETDIEKLSNETKHPLPSYFPWLIYAAGLLLIAAAVFDLNRQKSPSELQQQQSKIRDICSTILAIDLSETTIANVSASLRELQIELGESTDVDMQIQIDKLVGECDAISFRPSGDTAEERSRLLDSAKEIARSIT